MNPKGFRAFRRFDGNCGSSLGQKPGKSSENKTTPRTAALARAGLMRRPPCRRLRQKAAATNCEKIFRFVSTFFDAGASNSMRDMIGGAYNEIPRFYLHAQDSAGYSATKAAARQDGAVCRRFSGWRCLRQCRYTRSRVTAYKPPRVHGPGCGDQPCGSKKPSTAETNSEKNDFAADAAEDKPLAAVEPPAAPVSSLTNGRRTRRAASTSSPPPCRNRLRLRTAILTTPYSLEIPERKG